MLPNIGRTILPFLFLSSVARHEVSAATKDDYYQLYDYLFGGNFYKKEIRPADNQNVPLVVSMNFYLLSIVDVNEKQQMLETSARLEMSWVDDYLEWDTASYGGISQILVPQKIVYVPDIVLGNSVSAQKQIGYDQLPIRLTNNGSVIWEPTLLLSTDCDIDITYFPFESQLCKVEFETAVSRSLEIDIDVYKGTSIVHLGDFTTNGQWELIDTSAENLSNEDGKTKIRFSLVMKRRRTFYILNIILPVFFLSLTSSLVFALPADEGEKMGTGITVLLAFAVYLTIVSDLVPNTSLQVSILGLYLTILLGLSAVSSIICVFNLRIFHREEDRPVGSKTARFIRFCRYVMCLTKSDDDDAAANQVSPSRSRAGMHDANDVNVSMSRLSMGRNDKTGRIADSRASMATLTSQEPMTWQLVAHTLDWMCFIFFSACTFLVTIILLLYLHFGSIVDAPSL